MSGYAVRNDGVYGCRIIDSSDSCASNESYSEIWVDQVPTLAAIKVQACSRIDAKAEALRQKILTPGSGQTIDYQCTRAEVAAMLVATSWQKLYGEAVEAEMAGTAGTTLVAGTYPLLAANQASLAASGTSLTLAEVAELVIAQAADAYPFLSAEQAAITATSGPVSLIQVATLVQSKIQATDKRLAAIKAAKRTATERVRLATDTAGVASAEAAVVWPEG